MEVEIDLKKSLEENAGIYFDKAKKAKKKLKGAAEAIEQTKKQLAKLEKEESKFLKEEEKKEVKKVRKKEWYEKFHWFISSEGFLCIGGKDATSNEIIIKKHTEKSDLVFHTEMPGSPFFIVKNGVEAGEITLKETAQATAVYSRAWKRGLGTAEVYSIKPEQVSKTAQSGEYLTKGSFMIYGKRTYFRPKMEYAIGLVEDEIISGPLSAVEKKTKKFVVVVIGKYKKSDLAKKIKHKLKGGDVDDIVKFLPTGGAEMRK
tara:strand:+ start:455 stop:1234 length:780 start_codon:yes stop_codon:yes gene_type:complete